MSLQKIHPDSVDCANSELDLFTVPPTNAQIDRGHYESHQPLASLEGCSPLEFTVSGTDDYLDLHRTCLRLKVKIIKPEKVLNIAPVNNFIHSLFSQVDVFLNDKLISSSNTFYPYRSYFETLLNYNREVLQSQLTCGLWYQDTPGEFETCGEANKGWKKRKDITEKNSVELMGWLHCDMFNQDKFLLNHVDVRIRMVKSKNAFCLMSDTAEGDINVKFEEATLYVRKVRPVDSVILAHAQILARTDRIWKTDLADVRMFSISPGMTAVTKGNLFMGQLPSRIIIGLVDSTSINGSLQKNPFNFQHFDLNYLSLHIGNEQFPSQPLTPDYKMGNYLRCYQTLLEGVDAWKYDKSVPFDREEYGKGNTLYAFQLNPESKECTDYFNALKQGNLCMELKFSKPLVTSIAVVIYAEFQNLLEIDYHRKVFTDFTQ